MTNTTTSQPPKVLRLPAVLSIYGTRESQLRKDVAQELMTTPIKPSFKVIFWPESEVVAVAAARIAGRSQDEIRALVRRLHEKRQADARTLVDEA